jgi:hypothetical protein
VIFVVFENRAAFDAFKAEFPRTLADPDTLLGDPAHEFTDEETGEGSGLCFMCHHFTSDEAAILQMAGADVRVGGIDGPEFGSETEE